MAKTFNIKGFGDTEFEIQPHLNLVEVTDFVNGTMHNIGISFSHIEDGAEQPFSSFTVNFGEYIGMKNCAYVDTNNSWFADELLKAGIAEDTGLSKLSGYYKYPLWHFKEDFLKEVNPEVYQTYTSEYEKYTKGFRQEAPNEELDTDATTQKINVLICEPMTAPYMKEIDSGLESMQATVGGLIQAIYPFEDEVALVCNEEGKLEGLMLNRAVYGENGEMIDIIAGTFFIAGLTEDSFGSLTPERAEKYGNLFQFPEIFVREGDEIKALPIKPSVRDKLKANTAEIKKESSDKAHNKSEHEI